MDPTKAQTVATFAHLKKDKANKVGADVETMCPSRSTE